MLLRLPLLGSRYCCVHRAHARGLSSSCSPRTSIAKLPSANPATDELGLPLSPTWSVHDLISSYPSPTLSNSNLTRLHDLAALVPPEEDTPEFEKLKLEMEVLVRLVEAVKMAPTGAQEPEVPSNSEGNAAGLVIVLDQQRPGAEQDKCNEPPSGQELLRHSQRTRDGFYLVDSARTKP